MIFAMTFFILYKQLSKIRMFSPVSKTKICSCFLFFNAFYFNLTFSIIFKYLAGNVILEIHKCRHCVSKNT